MAVRSHGRLDRFVEVQSCVDEAIGAPDNQLVMCLKCLQFFMRACESLLLIVVLYSVGESKMYLFNFQELCRCLSNRLFPSGQFIWT